MRQQIAQLEKTVAEQKARIEELEQQVIALNVKRARETVRHREKLVEQSSCRADESVCHF